MKSIIACLDNSSLSQAVTEAAIWSAERSLQTVDSAPLIFLNTVEQQHTLATTSYSGMLGLDDAYTLIEDMTALEGEHNKLAIQLGQKLLDTAASQADHLQHVRTLQRHGDLNDCLKELVDQTRLVILGRRGEGHEQERSQFKALGSHIETVIRESQHPIVIVPASFKAPAHFMLAYDGRATAKQAIERIIDDGLLKGLSCHLVTVNNNDQATADSLEVAARRLRDAGFEVQATLLEGNIYHALTDYQAQHQIELLVMGAFSHSKIKQFFVGSNTLRMIQDQQIPLVIMK